MGTTSDPVLVASRYRGTAELLAALLAPLGAVTVVGVDADGVDALDDAVRAARGVVVVTAAPGDPTLAAVRAAIDPGRVVVVTWHPADERPSLPDGVPVLEPDTIRARLLAVVTDLRGARG
ncbi:hypothetical protein [Euzebya sp.]|uniref:hypothetical protein n=1 Tax=Euzebya sp. TaxID=1971409 RepID=UPI003511A51B